METTPFLPLCSWNQGTSLSRGWNRLLHEVAADWCWKLGGGSSWAAGDLVQSVLCSVSLLWCAVGVVWSVCSLECSPLCCCAAARVRELCSMCDNNWERNKHGPTFRSARKTYGLFILICACSSVRECGCGCTQPRDDVTHRLLHRALNMTLYNVYILQYTINMVPSAIVLTSPPRPDPSTDGPALHGLTPAPRCI